MTELGSWPTERAGEALAQLADVAGLSPRTVELGAPGADLASWLDEAASWLGIDATPIAAPVAQVSAMLQGSAPALLVIDSGVIALLAVRGRRATVVTPEGSRQRVPLGELTARLAAPVVAPVREALASELAALELGDAKTRRAADALVAMRTRSSEVGGVIALRIAPHAPLSRHVRAHRFGTRFASVAAAHAGSYLAGLAAWWAIGRGALGGRLDGGWLAAWALLLLTAVAIRIVGMWAMGRLAIDAAALIKQRLLGGALRADLDALRVEGVGLSLGRVFEATAVERLTINGGFLALFAVIELGFAIVVLAMGAGGLVHVALLAAVLAATAFAIRHYARERRAWTERRLSITHELIEAMIGHATRLAQQPAGQRHHHEDRALLAYTTHAAAMDRTLVALQALVPRGWLLVGTGGLAPVIVGGGVTASSLALSLGGVLLAYAALQKLTYGAAQLVGAANAWRAIAPLLAAATRTPTTAPPGMVLAPPSPAQPVATLRSVVYRPARRVDAVLAGCDLTIERGDHYVLEGPSGAGKSTLAAMLAGLRRPDGGLVLAGGLDFASLGERGWRRRIACAPQFHENHLYSASLAFNLLLGHSWPPRFADVSRAWKLCEELGLGDLLRRMPAGIFETVGESGWQLSHGERSRVFLARALLQGAPLVVLDESLAALDPETLRRAIACIERHAPAALVIAHP